MTQEQFHVGIHTVVDSVHHQVGQGAAELGADALHGQLLGVDDGVVGADLGQEPGNTLSQRTLLVFTHEQSDRGIIHQDLLHAVEELGAGDGLGTDPHLLFPVAHGIGVGSAPLVAGTHEVMGQIGVILQESNLGLWSKMKIATLWDYFDLASCAIKR